MPMPVGLYNGAARCAVCGTFVMSGVLCPSCRPPKEEAGGHKDLAPGLRRTVEEVALEELAVPPSYQREERPQLVRRIVREFDADLLGLLTVCRDAGGELWILDGQHRWLALVDLGYERALCEVLHDVPLSRQAQIFSGRNGRRIAPHPRDAFKADYVAKDPAVVAIVQILRRHGYRDPFGAHRASSDRFVCVGALREIHTWGQLEAAVEILRQAWPNDALATQAPILTGLGAFGRVYPQASRSELVARLTRHSANEVLKLARARQATDRERRPWVHVAAVLVEIYNHGRRETNRLPLLPIPAHAAKQWKERRG